MELNEAIEYIKRLSDPAHPLKHENYAESVSHANEMGVHIYGDSPAKLLTSYRPNEPKIIYEYRQSIFLPITKSKSKKVINVLKRINNASNYKIDYPKDKSSLIPEGQDIETYLTKDYPFMENIIKWLFELVLKQDMADPNSVVAVRPVSEVAEDEMLRPYGFIYSAEQVWDYILDEYFTILVSNTIVYKSGTTVMTDGKRFHIYDKEKVMELTQIGKESNGKPKYSIKILFTHDFNEVPVFLMGGEYIPKTHPPLYESYMSGVLPYWDEALREFSDKQAVFVQHIYLERVEVQVECDVEGCKNGKIYNESAERDINCPKCSGTGYISGRSPYGVTVVKTDGLEKDKQIFPGVEYIDKPTEIVELLLKDIKNNIDDGFSALNMDILKEVGENQSGIAKTIDRIDLDSYILTVSNNLFGILKTTVKFTNKWRYGIILKDRQDDLKANEPIINAPTEFDVLSALNSMNEIARAKESGLSDELIELLTLDFILKRFANDKDKKRLSIAIMELDPMPNKSEDDKVTILLNGGTTKENYILSTNIKPFILRALFENKEFLTLDRAKQLEILNKYVIEHGITKERKPIDNSTE